MRAPVILILAGLGALAAAQPGAATSAPPPVGAAAPGPAAAAPTDNWVGRPWIATGYLGLGGATASLAAELEFRLLRYVSLAGSAGLGWSGPQGGGMARLRVPFLGVAAVGVGAGLSGGAYELPLSFDDEPGRFQGVRWGNVEAFIEGVRADGRFARAVFGRSTVLDPGSCVTNSCAHPPRGTLPYFGFALGAAF